MAVQNQQRSRGDNLLDAALSYVTRGWRVIPLHSPSKGGRCSCGKQGCPAVGKHPRTPQGLKDASGSEAVVRAWWADWPHANIGIVTGARSGLVVLDVDTVKGGLDSLVELEAEHEPLPTTLVAETGGGGYHYLFQHPGPDFLLRNRAGLDGKAGLDVRGDGGYIVATPSLHGSGMYYQWQGGAPETPLPDEPAIAPLPGWLLDLLISPPIGGDDNSGPQSGGRLPPSLASDDRQAAGQYWLDYYLARTGEGSRNDHGLKLACQLRDSGLSQDEAEGFMLTYADSVPGSGYTQHEARASLRQAFSRSPRENNFHSRPDVVEAPSFLTPSARAAFETYAAAATGTTRPRSSQAAGWDTVTPYGGTLDLQQNPDRDTENGRRAGSGTPQSGQDTLVDGYSTPRPETATTPGQDKPARFQFLLDTDVEDMPPPEWLVKGFLPANRLSVVYGEFGSCKSFLVLDWALSIATGEAWLGKHEVKKGQVAYIAGEGIGGMGRRIRAWKLEHGYKGSTGLRLLGAAPQFLQIGDLADLTNAIAALPEPPALIVIDTLARSMVGGDENSAKDMGLAVAAADALRVAFGSHVLIVHHKATGASKTRGSNALPGAAETLVEVTKDGDTVSLYCPKQKDAPPFDRMYLRTKQKLLSNDDPEDTSLVLEPKAGSRQQQRPQLPRSAETLLAIITKAPGEGLRYTVLRERFMAESKMGESSLNNALTILEDERLIKKVGDFWMATGGTTK